MNRLYCIPLIALFTLTSLRIAAQTHAEWDSLYQIGSAHQVNGEYKQASDYYYKCLDLYETGEYPTKEAQIYTSIGTLLSLQGNYEDALVVFRKALEINKGIGDPNAVMSSHTYIARAYLKQNNFPQAIEVLQKVLKTPAESVGKDALSISHILLGNIYRKQGNNEQALISVAKGLALQREMGNKEELSKTLSLQGSILTQSGDNEGAMKAHRESLKLAEELGFKQEIANSLNGIAHIYKRQEDFEKSIEYYRKGLQLIEDMGQKGTLAYVATDLGRVYMAKGDFEQAIPWCEKGLGIAEDIGLLGAQNYACDCLYASHKEINQGLQALNYLERQIVIKDSIEKAKTIKELKRIEFVQERMADSLAFVRQQADIELTYQAELAQRNYLLFGGLGIAILGIIFFRYRQKQNIKEHELELERERALQLEQIDRLKDQFLANTSHELRTPLNGIIGITESLFERSEDEETRKNLGMVVASGKRLAAIVNDLLDFSVIKNTDLVLKKRPVNLYTVVDVIFRSFVPLISGRNLELISEVPENLKSVLADENRLIQVLYNLIGNAIKFTEKGTIRVGATEKKGKIEVSVSDTGIGIPADRLAAIFEAFEQSDGSISRQYDGSGLGLSISKELVEGHGGKIWVESIVGEGSTFYFSLAISKEQAEVGVPLSETQLTPLLQFPTETAEIKPQIISEGGSSVIRILVVDDEPINHQVLKNHLYEERYEVHSAYHGEEAMRILDQDISFDLVLLDVMMPKASGYQVCQQIRKKFLPSELPVIMVTAKNQVADLVEGLNTGANDYIAKPFSKDEFLARIGTHLNLHRINQATSRFVPTEFIKTLGRNLITEVELGDNIEQELTVFFSDIRGYTSLSEQMTPDENFQFVNAYSQRMGPIIQNQQGFVNQFLGDGIMALFQQSPGDALKAAIESQEEIRRYNQDRAQLNRKSIEIGIGFHTGPLVMGIIGDHVRADAAIISDTVNTAARMEGLTKHYKANILLSGNSYQKLLSSDQEKCRFLGLVQLKGKLEPMRIYECIWGENEENRALKLATKENFQLGIESYIAGDFDEAEASLLSVLAKHPQDATAAYFLERVNMLKTTDFASEWDGVEKMEDK